MAAAAWTEAGRRLVTCHAAPRRPPTRRAARASRASSTCTCREMCATRVDPRRASRTRARHTLWKSPPQRQRASLGRMTAPPASFTLHRGGDAHMARSRSARRQPPTRRPGFPSKSSTWPNCTGNTPGTLRLRPRPQRAIWRRSTVRGRARSARRRCATKAGYLEVSGRAAAAEGPVGVGQAAPRRGCRATRAERGPAIRAARSSGGRRLQP